MQSQTFVSRMVSEKLVMKPICDNMISLLNF